jgi:hypothetical protein
MATPQVAAEAALLLSAGAPSSQVESLIEGYTLRHAALLAFTCVNAPDWTPTYNHTICTPAGIDEIETHLLYGSGTIQIPDALLATKSQAAYVEGSAWRVASTPATVPATAPSVGTGGGGSSSGGSAPAASSGSPSGGSTSGGGGGSLHEITSVRPASGPLGGGNTIAIVGYGFTGVREVRIGDKLAQFRFVNDAHIDVTVPAGDKLGTADVSVVLPPAVGRAFAPGGYVYTASQVVSTPEPAPSGGSEVTIPEKPFTPVTTAPKITVSGPRVAITAPVGSTSTSVQKKANGKWNTIRRLSGTTMSATVTLTKGNYRVVSTLANGTNRTRVFTVR